jgi:hypothetical protein
MQSKKHSFIESIIQTFIGLAVSFCIQLIIYPLMNIEVSFKQNILITFVFTIASIIRGYIIRRIFNKKIK